MLISCFNYYVKIRYFALFRHTLVLMLPCEHQKTWNMIITIEKPKFITMIVYVNFLRLICCLSEEVLSFMDSLN